MSTEYKDWLADFTKIQRQNYKLCMKYPILIPNNYLGKAIEDNFEYTYTCLDEIPLGWRKAFGLAWADEIQQAINEHYLQNPPEDEFDEINILQLKEKYGEFTQYFTHYTDTLRNISEKYKELSSRTCIICGEPAKYRTTDYICPYCNKHLPKNCAGYTKID